MAATQKARLNIGLIGGGFMGKAHSNAYHTIPYIFQPDGYTHRLAVLSAATEKEAAEAAGRYGFQRFTADYRSVIGDPDIDVVDICTPDATHKEVAMAALKAGKHVLCEKPLATSLQDALALAREAALSPKTAMCGHNYRFAPAVRLAKELIARGELGRVYSFHGVYNQDSRASESSSVISRGANTVGEGYNIGTHIIDMARFLIGDIESVMGSVRGYGKAAGSEQADDEMLAVVDFRNGAGGTIRSSVLASGRKNQLAWEINGSGGSVAFDMEDANFLSVFLADSPVREVSGFTRVNVTQKAKDHPYAEYWWPQGHGLGWEHAHVNEIAHFLASAAEGKPVSPWGATFEDGYRAILTVEAIRLSSREGRRVSLSELDELKKR